MPDIREEFEAWMIDRFAKDMGQHAAGIGMDTLETISREMWLRKVDGEYQAVVPREMWSAWQASRAALRVELPAERDETLGNSAVSEYQATKNQGFNDCLDRVTEALQQAGIEVKP